MSWEDQLDAALAELHNDPMLRMMDDGPAPQVDEAMIERAKKVFIQSEHARVWPKSALRETVAEMLRAALEVDDVQ